MTGKESDSSEIKTTKSLEISMLCGLQNEITNLIIEKIKSSEDNE